MSLSHIYNRRVLTIMKERKEGLKDTRVRDLFRLKGHKYKGTMFAMIRPRKEIARESIRYRGPVLWSKLRQPIRDSIDTFKKQLKNEKALRNVTFRKEASLILI